MVRLDVDQTISELTLTEKIALTAGEFSHVFSVREEVRLYTNLLSARN